MIKKEDLEKRIEALSSLREQHLANANAVSGALAECRNWLKNLEEDLNDTDASGNSPDDLQ